MLLAYVCHKGFHSGCAGIDTVDAEANEAPARPFIVSRLLSGEAVFGGQ